jgi:hypothetical protein
VIETQVPSISVDVIPSNQLSVIQQYDQENDDPIKNRIMEVIMSSFYPKNHGPTQEYDIKEDFNWFTSGKAETQQYKGQYIAIWKKKIVANGSSAVEVKKLATQFYGESIRCAIVYVPDDENEFL